MWGLAPIFQKRALRDAGLLELNAIRGITLLVLFVPSYYLFLGTDILLPGVEFYVAIAGIALVNNVVGDLLSFIALRKIGASLTVPITSSYPFIIALISWIWFGEELTLHVLGSTFIVVTGLVFLNMRGAPEAPGERAGYLRGVLSAVGAALCWAFGLSVNKYLTLQDLTPTAIIYWRGIFIGLMTIGNWGGYKAFHPAGAQSLRNIPKTGWLWGGVSAVLSLVIGTWSYTVSVTLIPVNVATPIGASCPLVTALIACAFMGERLRPLQWLGIVFVVAGAAALTS
jgi:drug/metabolite transporter (DMT)-like permease